MSEQIIWGKHAFYSVSHHTETGRHNSPDCYAYLQPWVGEIEEGSFLQWPPLQISF